MESLERLKCLHQDLTTFATTRLVNIERLWQELEASVQDFRQLLDPPAQDSIQTDSLGSKKITIDGDEYGVGDELINLGRAVGTALGLDEQGAVRAIIETQGTSVQLDSSIVRDVVTRVQDRRDFLLQDLRIVLKEAVDRVEDDTWQDRFHVLAEEILDVKNGPRHNGSAFARRCMKAMADIERRHDHVGNAIQGKINIDGHYASELYDSWGYQKASLFKQHEALAAILAYLFKGNFTTSDDLQNLITLPRNSTRLDFQLVHYLPAFSAAFRQYGSPDHSSSKDDALSIDTSLAQRDLSGDRVVLQPFYAVLSLWWITEYSGWFREPASETTGVDARQRSVKTALDDHALEFLLSLCKSMNFDPWRHPARQEIVGLLLSETSGLTLEDEQTSDFFSTLFMECLETFAEAWITNMPDSIRQLKTEEDDLRLTHMTALQSGLEIDAATETPGRLHLECLLVLMSFAFENRPLASEELFWQDLEGNMFGFVQWSSKRQTVPRAAAFCEMLCSISEGAVCAAAAHNFLIEESTTSSRSRRNPSMNYTQMFAELALYARKVHERPTAAPLPQLRKVLATDMNELESPVMLSCYLRLITHLCCQTNLTRELIFSNTSADLITNLLMLSSGPIPGYLRGSIFQTLSALLTEKTAEVGSTMWKTIDNWAASGQTSFSSTTAKADQLIQPSFRVLQNTLSSISDSYEQSDAFLVMLCALLAPSPDDSSYGPILQFPADLGAAYRPAGISPYVDFVLGQLFTKRISELTDPAQSRTLLLHSLDFIVACLSSFNETFVALADKPSSSTKTSQTSRGTTSVTTYAQTHPFARTMKWLFSSDASKALLTAMHQQADEVAVAPSQSPLIVALERCMDVINIILDTQPTYVDIVRPLVNDFDRDTFVPPSAITAFEETISARPEIIHDLCMYAASDDHDLVYRALVLLDLLSRSKKLNSFFIQRGHSGIQMNRVLDMLGPNATSDLAPVCSALGSHLECDIPELEEESSSPGYTIKDTVLSFFNRCLASQSDLPNIAHLLLGFARIGQRLDIAPDSMLESGTAVFNSVLTLALVYPVGDQLSDTWSWLLHIKTACIKVLQSLWSSQISAAIAINQLRKFAFLAGQFGGLVVVNRMTLWDGVPISAPSFWLGKPAEGLFEFLEHRASLYDYAATEIRDISASNLTSLQRHWLSTILGKSTTLDGVQVTHASIYDLFDFLDLDINTSLPMPTLKHFADVKLETYKSDPTEEPQSLYDIDAIREVLRYHYNRLTSSQHNKPSADDEAEIEKEADYILNVLLAKNRLSKVIQVRRSALHNLVEVLIAALDRCSMEAAARVQFILQMLQIILPKLDAFVLNDAQDSIELARAAEALLLSLTRIPSNQLQGRVENSIADRLFQLFRISIEGITMADSSPALRTVLYSNCSQYLTRVLDTSDPNRRAQRHSLDCVKSAGMRLINILSDDAEDGLDTSKPAALNLLGLFSSLARSEKSPYLIESLLRANALELLVDPIKIVAAEFQEAVPVARKYLLTVLEARMFLLLQLSRTREGAGAILDAGLMQAVRDSMIFSADPDLGMDVDNVEALHNYYELVASILRVLVSTFLSRGLQNEQCQFLMRSFLQDYRPNMVGLFKRFNGVNGKAAAKSQDLLKEIVNAYVALAAMSGFVEFEEEDSGGLGSGRRMNGFS